MARKFHWPARVAALLLVNSLFVLTRPGDAADTAALALVCQALVLAYSCFLLLPARTRLRDLAGNGALALVLLAIFSQLSPSGGISAATLLRTAIVLAALGLFLSSLSSLLQSLLARGPMPIAMIYGSLLLLAAPVWLGPLVEITRPADWIVNAIVAVSPLTHFSVAAEYDYLRGDWFYRHSAFGSLPFRYPGLASIAGGYMIATAFFLAFDRWIRLRRRHPAGSDPITNRPILEE